MILYTPIIGPKIVPNNWDEWWEVWNTYSSRVTKTKTNHNNQYNNPWVGIDLYNITRPEHGITYGAPLVPPSPVTLDLVKQVIQVSPITPFIIRVIENTEYVKLHSDNQEPTHQFRSVLWNTYNKPLWELEYNGEHRIARLPEDSNSFYFRDYPLKHAAIHEDGASKGLIVVYGFTKDSTENLINASAERYSEYAWVTDEN